MDRLSGRIDGALWQTYQACYFSQLSRINPVQRGALISLMVPHGQVQSRQQTFFTIRRSLAALHKSTYPFSLWFGGSKDMHYRECSAWVACSLSEAHRLAKQLRQNAFYWIDNNKLTLIATGSTRQVLLPCRFSDVCLTATLPATNQAIRG